MEGKLRHYGPHLRWEKKKGKKRHYTAHCKVWEQFGRRTERRGVAFPPFRRPAGLIHSSIRSISPELASFFPPFLTTSLDERTAECSIFQPISIKRLITDYVTQDPASVTGRLVTAPDPMICPHPLREDGPERDRRWTGEGNRGCSGNPQIRVQEGRGKL